MKHLLILATVIAFSAPSMALQSFGGDSTDNAARGKAKAPGCSQKMDNHRSVANQVKPRKAPKKSKGKRAIENI